MEAVFIVTPSFFRNHLISSSNIKVLKIFQEPNKNYIRRKGEGDLVFEKDFFPFLKSNQDIYESIQVKNTDEIIDLPVNYRVVILSGANKISKNLIDFFIKNNVICLNLHFGISRKYRGLDSNMWALRNKDFNSLGTTIHLVEEKIDTGKVIIEDKINLKGIDSPLKFKMEEIKSAIRSLRKLSNMNQQKIRDFKYIEGKCIGKYYGIMTLNEKKEAYRYINELNI